MSALARATKLGTADPARILARIDELAALSEGGPGVSRLAYTPLERRAHAVFGEWMTQLGCAVHVDAAGNTIAEYAGSTAAAAAIGTGSHLDSVYEGGAYDGVAGVVAGVEAVTLLAAAEVRLAHPLRVVAFAGEEGARFGQACLGSRLAAGLTSPETFAELVDRDGMTLADAMSQVGLDPVAALAQRWDPSEWAAFLELHIEQGRILEQAGAQVAPVDLISGSTRLRFAMTGRPSHTGGTPMHGRSDALAAAAEAVLIAEHVASDDTHRGTRATVGRLGVEPNSITTIPGHVTFSLDIRDVDADRQRQCASEIVSRITATCRRRGIGLEVELIADTSPVVLPLWVRQALADAAKERGVPYRVLTSGASHDAQMINAIVPTALLFVPSRDGLSHVPEEWTDAADIARGVDVLLGAVISLDSTLEREGASR